MTVPMSRRTLLQATGVAIGLPLLEAMMPVGKAHARMVEPLPRRTVLIGQPLGMYGPNFFPEQGGSEYVPSRYLKHLETHRQHMTVISGMSHRYAAGHYAEVGLFTGVAPEFIREKSIKNGISLDQEMAAHIGNKTRFSSLILGGGDVAWNRRGVRLPAETRAVQIFRKLFIAGSTAQQTQEIQRLQNGQSILDDVRDQIQSLNRRVGQNDRARLESYLSSLREAEQSLAQDELWSKTPKPQVPMPAPTSEFSGAQLIERSRQWYDIVRLALETDSTRVISLWLGTQDRPEITGVNIGHHDASHHGQDPAKLEQLSLIEEAEIKAFGEFLDKLQASRDGDQSLLDRTAVLYTSNLGNSSSHDNNNLPILLAGGSFKHRGHLAFNTKQNTLMANLFVRMLHHMQIEAERFGASTSVLSDI